LAKEALDILDEETSARRALRRTEDSLETRFEKAEALARLADVDGHATLYPGLTAQAAQRGNPMSVKTGPDGFLTLLDRGEQALQREVIFDLLDMVAGLKAELAELKAG
jgi:hypothetical protein